MKYYKDKKNSVFAYDDDQLAQVTRLDELELLLQEKEPIFLDASNNLDKAKLELDTAKELLNEAIANQPIIDVNEDEIRGDDGFTPIDNKDDEYNREIQRLTLLVNDKTVIYNNTQAEFNKIEPEYQSIKTEYEAVLNVFFDIRDNLKIMKKMTAKEVDAYLNPPVSKEQLIAEAEQHKQSLLMEANSAIAPLQDAIDLDMATDEEISLLKDWKKYRVLLNRVDTSTAPDIDWSEKP